MDLAPIGGAPYGQPKFGDDDSRALYLRRVFAVAKSVRRARLYATARGLYQVLLDGKAVGNASFAPGWTDYRKRIQYQTYDVTDQLAKGDHAMGIVLGSGWYSGHVGLTGGGNYGDQPYALAQLVLEYTDGTTETVATDANWRGSFGPILSQDLLMGESFDARKALGNWSAASYSDSKWDAVSMQTFPAVPLVAQTAPVVTKVEELTPKRITHPNTESYVFDLGQNMVGWARLRVKGPAGQTVRLRFAEMLNPDGTIYTTNLRGAKATDFYTLAGRGQEVYEPTFTFHGFRYVELVGYPGVPNKDAVRGIVVSSDNTRTGDFECSNPLVNQLQSNIFWGQRGNYLEIPTDCPQRDERLGWMGDAQIFARTATFNNDVAAFLGKYTQDIEDAQGAEGGFSDVSPRMGDQSDGAPAWGDAGVIVPWTIYQAYGDKRILASRYKAMQKWIAYIDSANPDHQWLNRQNNSFGDWLNVDDDTPREVLATAYFARSTDLLARSARVLGRGGDAARYEQLLDQIRTAFVKNYVSADGSIRGDTQTGYILALRFNLLPESLRANAAQRLVDAIMVKRKGHLSTGFLGVGALNPTLTSIGRSDVAYQLLTTDTYPSWGYSIRQGATTIWERWDGWTQEKGFQDPGMNSFNHYSLGSVGEWMYGTVAGLDLDPAKPGYENIIVRPIPGGGFTWARAKYDSIRGRIETSWRTRGQRFELDVTVPGNTTATVYVPTQRANSATEGGQLASSADGVRYLGHEAGCDVFRVGGGTYQFQGTLPRP
jgi:alpha-L-rhamnosidase